MSSPVKPSDIQSTIADPSDNLCGNFVRALLKLPVLLWRFFSWMLDSDGNFTAAFTTAISNATIRPGDLIFSAKSVDTTGRLLCNGDNVSRSTYADLFSAIGVTYGVGDGSTTFHLPDFRDKFPVGAGNTYSIGQANIGTNLYTSALAENQLPRHKHFITIDGTSVDAAQPSEEGRLFENGADEIAWGAAADVKVGKTRDYGPGTPATQVGLNIPLVPASVACYVYIKT